TQSVKPRIVFVRPGGAPLTNLGFPPFQASGPLSQVAEKLRDYNFEVLEKDVSGTYAMQAQMRGMPTETEAIDEQLKDAIWVVLAAPSGNPQTGEMPGALGSKLSAHLKQGGSAMVIPFPQEPTVAAALAPYGIA